MEEIIGRGFPGMDPAATGYTRITGNLCMKTIPSSTGVSLTRNVITLIASPSVNARAVILDIVVKAGSANAIGARRTEVICYANLAATIYLATIAVAIHEEVAISAGTTLLESWQRVTTPGASLYLRMADDAGDQGTATYEVVGYYD